MGELRGICHSRGIAICLVEEINFLQNFTSTFPRVFSKLSNFFGDAAAMQFTAVCGGRDGSASRCRIRLPFKRTGEEYRAHVERSVVRVIRLQRRVARERETERKGKKINAPGTDSRLCCRRNVRLEAAT